MADQTYYAVVNDRASPSKPEYDECINFCRDGAGNPLIVEEKEAALSLRDKHRENPDNPGINVYPVTLNQEPVGRKDEGGA